MSENYEPPFKEDSRARYYHHRGLVHATANPPELAKAHGDFDQALYFCGENDPTSPPEKPDLWLQAARIKRDKAFTLARAYIPFEEPDLGAAYSELIGSKSDTTLLINLGEKEKFGFTTEQWQFLWAEHGATIGLLGRVATIAVVLGYSKDTGLSMKDAQEYYHSAHFDWLRRGSNRFYEASNAGNAMRHERLLGHLGSTSVWLARANWAVAKAVLGNQRNSRTARKTVIHRLPALASRQAARRSILAKP